jgi:D-alanyl-D-alanine carboxypeptidase
MVSGCTITDSSGPPITDYQSVIDWYAADTSIPGVVALVAQGDSIWAGASGDADLYGGFMDPDDKMRMASLTKPFTATVILQMTEEGVLGLDESIVPFFDRDVVDSLVIIDGQSYGYRVTTRMLLSHRSGIYDYADADFYNLIRADPSRRWLPLELVQYAYRNGQPYFVPDAIPENDYGYSNTNYILLGMIAEQIDGKAFHQILRDRVLRPLSLSNTFLAEYEAIPPTVASGYDGDVDVSSYDYGFEWSSAGIVSTVGDVHTFLDALMDGRLFMHASTLETMRNPNGYGLGLAATVTSEGILGYGHVGQSLGFVSVMMYVPSKQAFVIASMNQRTADVTALYLDLLSLVP